LVLDVAAVEAAEAAEKAEKSIDELVDARSRSQEEANHAEMAWKESTRRFNLTRHQEYAQSWYEHHSRQLAALEATFGVLTARHRAERNRFGRMLGINIPDDGPEVA
jgi:histidinol-phosphate/aromatic aminotransferase/cobyric acid decarboxylase-like protein